jgi:hypothetical protein
VAAIAAIVYSVLMGIIVLFQCALALGMPWGEYSMGGRFPGKYPSGMRAVAVFNALLLSAFILTVLTRAGLVFPGLSDASSVVIWFVVGYSALAVILNTITPSKKERKLWAPVTGVQLIAILIVAIR